MNEMQETADHVVLIAAGRLVASLGMAELLTRASGVVRVAGEDVGACPRGSTGEGATVTVDPDGRLNVSGIDSRAIGRIALELRVVLDELSPERGGLEQTFLDLTSTMEPVAMTTRAATSDALDSPRGPGVGSAISSEFIKLISVPAPAGSAPRARSGPRP